MRRHANTLYVTTQGAYVRRDHATLQVKIENEVRLTVPLHHLDGVVCFGRVTVSHGVYEAVQEHGLAVSFLTQHGRFLARAAPPTQGNVLLRRTQYRLADDPFEINNLIDDPSHAERLQQLRRALQEEMLATRDTGLMPEGMMKQLAGDRTVYEYAQSDAYPLDRVIELANQATQQDVSLLPKFIAALEDPHPLLRYWGALGCVILGRHAAGDLSPALRRCDP